MDGQVSSPSTEASQSSECADKTTLSPNETVPNTQASVVTETSSDISRTLGTFSDLPQKDSTAYFDSRLDYLHEAKDFSRLTELLIALGKLAIDKNTAFLNSLMNVGDYTEVEHGEVCASKLTGRFFSWGRCDSKYIFTLTNGIVQAMTDRNTDLFYVLNGTSNAVTIGGPQGGGKSFLLQYIVRKLRSIPSNRVIYIPNPDLFFNTGNFNRYYLVVAEIIFAFASDLTTESGLVFKKKLLAAYKGMAASWIGKSPGKLSAVVKSVRKFCAAHGLSCVIVLDQENVFGRLLPKDPNYKYHQAIGSLLKARAYFSRILTSTSMTSETLQTGSPQTLVKFIPQLSDSEILALINTAYRIKTPLNQNLETPELGLEALLENCGRWFQEITAVINLHITNGSGIVLNSYVYRKSLLLKVGPHSSTHPVVTSHRKWIKRISRQTNGLENFFALLSIVDCCPPISHDGVVTFRKETEVNASADNKIPSDLTYQEIVQIAGDLKTKNPDFNYKKHCAEAMRMPATVTSTVFPGEYLSLESFSGHPSLCHLADPSTALQFIDERFFYIDSNLFVRSSCIKAATLIKADHRGRNAYMIYRNLYEADVPRDSVILGRLYESSVLSWLRSEQVPFVLKMSVTSLSMNTARSLSVKISEWSYMSFLTAESFVSQPNRFKETLLIPVESQFPIIDFCIISNQRGDPIAEKYNLVPLLVEKSQYEDKYNAVPQNCTCRDLILVQVTRNVANHKSSDTKLIKSFKAAHKSVAKKKEKSLIDNGQDLPNACQEGSTDSNAREPEEPLVSSMMSGFIESCLESNLRPRIYFIWLTCQKSGISSIHSSSLMCQEYCFETSTKEDQPPTPGHALEQSSMAGSAASNRASLGSAAVLGKRTGYGL